MFLQAVAINFLLFSFSYQRVYVSAEALLIVTSSEEKKHWKEDWEKKFLIQEKEKSDKKERREMFCQTVRA